MGLGLGSELGFGFAFGFGFGFGFGSMQRAGGSHAVEPLCEASEHLQGIRIGLGTVGLS